MKIACTASGPSLDDQLDGRFGRASVFIIYDLESDSFEVRDNAQNLEAAQGAGIQAAQHVAQSGARAVITGHTGPKAFKVLESAGIAIFVCSAMTVRQAIAAYREGSLTQIREADVEGHWV